MRALLRCNKKRKEAKDERRNSLLQISADLSKLRAKRQGGEDAAVIAPALPHWCAINWSKP